ncbi:hypothetical protein [Flavonifractor sp. An100]|uniref:hypothetical protein n=1 Tax=Flavonifractor sp. An100 TaxID=1965538 RepID=UPI000B38957F|nr:hypothetical protein [Flavonifractor sp. An100]OUQ76041.1 hypothetical protein B5E43_12845 [Flavonifractor sp. An100]
MSLKETLGLRSHKEDPKLFWFSLTLLCLLLGTAAALAALFGAPGHAVWGVLWRVLLSWALVCSLLTHAQEDRRRSKPPFTQIQLENSLLLLAAVLAVLDALLRLFPQGAAPYPPTFSAVALYFIARIACPRLRDKSPFSTREILLILACGVLACVLLIPFLDTAATVLSGL